MELKYGELLIIDVFQDHNYTLNSVDNKFIYQFEYTINEDSNLLDSKYGIVVKNCNDVILKSAIVISGGGGTTSPNESTVLIDEENLIVTIGNSVCSLSIPNLKLNWVTKCVNTVICFEIFKVKNDYIIHGELSILKIRHSGEIEWEFFGRDIFTTVDGTDDFRFEDDLIVVKDWENNVYKLDLNGKQVTE